MNEIESSEVTVYTAAIPTSLYNRFTRRFEATNADITVLIVKWTTADMGRHFV